MMKNPAMKEAMARVGGTDGLADLMKNPQMMAMAQKMMKDPQVRKWLCVTGCVYVYLSAHLCLSYRLSVCYVRLSIRLLLSVSVSVCLPMHGTITLFVCWIACLPRCLSVLRYVDMSAHLTTALDTDSSFSLFSHSKSIFNERSVDVFDSLAICLPDCDLVCVSDCFSAVVDHFLFLFLHVISGHDSIYLLI